MNRELQKVKEIIEEEVEKAGLKLQKIILFGSRARGDYTVGSDWDLLILLKDDFTREEKRQLVGNLYRRTAKLKGSYEIIIKKESEFEMMKDVVGSLSYEANLEGVTI